MTGVHARMTRRAARPKNARSFITASNSDCLYLRLRTRRLLVRLKSMGGPKVISPRRVDQRGRQVQRAPFEGTNIRNPIQKISRLTTLHRAVFLSIFMEQVTHARVVYS